MAALHFVLARELGDRSQADLDKWDARLRIAIKNRETLRQVLPGIDEDKLTRIAIGSDCEIDEVLADNGETAMRYQ
jgi:hypothetical protein